MRTIPAAEFVAWMEFHNAEPFGGVQDDYRAAVAAILPASAMNGEQYDPGSLFATLAKSGSKESKRANRGRNFRLYAVANCPALAAVAADRTRAD